MESKLRVQGLRLRVEEPLAHFHGCWPFSTTPDLGEEC